MALPYALRPSVILRRKALRQGVLGPSLFWKVVAAWVFGSRTIKKFFGKEPESLGTWKVGSNEFVSVINAKPMSKRQRKQAGLTRDVIVTRAVAAARAKNPNRHISVRTK